MTAAGTGSGTGEVQSKGMVTAASARSFERLCRGGLRHLRCAELACLANMMGEGRHAGELRRRSRVWPYGPPGTLLLPACSTRHRVASTSATSRLGKRRSGRRRSSCPHAAPHGHASCGGAPLAHAPPEIGRRESGRREGEGGRLGGLGD
jgi:hypothetical protein